MADAAHSFARTLYDILPAHYRTRDTTADLRAYLAGCGELLDAVYATLRQRYGDNYPDNPSEAAAIAACQDWLLPYFAELLDTRLLSPLVEGRRDEFGERDPLAAGQRLARGGRSGGRGPGPDRGRGAGRLAPGGGDAEDRCAAESRRAPSAMRRRR